MAAVVGPLTTYPEAGPTRHDADMDEGWDERHREAMEPVEEAGGGEAEGFEMAEERLIEEAENFDEGRSPLRDEIDEAEPSDPRGLRRGRRGALLRGRGRRSLAVARHPAHWSDGGEWCNGSTAAFGAVRSWFESRLPSLTPRRPGRAARGESV